MSALKHIAAFYHFQPVPPERLSILAARLESLGIDANLRGLIIFAGEGVNGTISGETQASVIDYLRVAAEILNFPEFSPKWSESSAWPFRKFRVRQRAEIVTLGKPEVQPLAPCSTTHLSPSEWDEAMQDPDALLLDTRNWYETRIGRFPGATAPDIEEFREFGDYLDRAEIPKDKKVLIYCTGGIRCEKAIVEMQNKGFVNVYQLDGGILNYLAQSPAQKFEGECFVFDSRVAVDQKLQPTTTYKMCPHCGQPAEQLLACLRCESEAIVCIRCRESEELALHTCSKNCAHHYRLAPGKKGRSQNQGYRYRVVDRLRPR